jgi:hypothetical protein
MKRLGTRIAQLWKSTSQLIDPLPSRSRAIPEGYRALRNRTRVNRAANLIDGPEVAGNVVDFRQEATPKATVTEKQAI